MRTFARVTIAADSLRKWNCQHSVVADLATVFNVITAGDGAVGHRSYYVQLSIAPCSGLWIKEQDCIVV